MVASNRKLKNLTCRGLIHNFNGRLREAGMSEDLVERLSLAVVDRGILKTAGCSKYQCFM
jgi:hypothetical protein